MVNSGTEASMSAIRLARAATGRDRLIKFAGAYHGHVDGLLAEAGSGLATQAIPASPGVPRAQAEATAIVPWNDFVAVEQAVDMHEPAAILCEPIPANMGLIPPAEGFLRAPRDVSPIESGALLICDEVISGFRVARGGAQELLGVAADLTVMGKVIGGGLPAAAYGGSRELMERVAPAGDVYQAGTLSGNPLGRRRRPRHARSARQRRLRAAGGLDRAPRERPRPRRRVRLRRRAADQHQLGPRPRHPLLRRRPVPHDFAGAQACDLDAYGAFCRAMLERGFFPPPSQFEAWFVSLAHDDAAIDATCEAAAECFGEALS